MSLFHNITKEIQDKELHSTEDSYITIIKQTKNTIEFFDATDGEEDARTIKLKDPNNITRYYLNKLIIFSDAYKKDKSLFKISKKKLIEYLFANTDKNMLMSVQAIAIITGDEEDTDSIYSDPRIIDGIEDMHDFPMPDQIGLTWWNKDVIILNAQAIQEVAIETNADNYFDNKDEVNIGILCTLLHEIRHTAQNNLWLPKEILSSYSSDPEEDAEQYAILWFEEHKANILR